MDSMLYVNGEFVSDHEDVILSAAGPEDVELKPCLICSRTFVPSALEKHEAICEKMAVQKRMPFDSFRQRQKGTELTHYHSSTYGSANKSKISKHQANSSSVSSIHEPIQKISDQKQRVSSNFQSYKAETPLMTRSLKRTLGPINEVCPHCGRSFGTRAYDRHVEWCKEKTKITNNTLSAQQHLAKERMQARTKYKAPMLRSKREKNREKYSSLSESINNLSDSGDVSIVDFNSVADPFERARKSSIMSLSMSSSIASDCPISGNKYDPFISARQQFNDLFSNDSPITSTPIKGVESLAKDPLSCNFSNQVKNLNNSKSSFRRTSSLRTPKKTSSISFVPRYKPSIQRGISDEGPISSNFMKPEEFDELPVKSHAIIPPDLVPRVSPTKQLNREKTPVSPIIRSESNKIYKRSSLSPESHKKLNNFQLTKTDSLAAFLKFENDLEYSIPNEKTGINHSPKNICNGKMNSAEIANSTAHRIQNNDANQLPIESPLNINKLLLDPMVEITEPNIKNIGIDGESTETHILKPKNSCDKLEISNSIGVLNGIHDPNKQIIEKRSGTKVHSTLKISSSTESIDSHRNMENLVNLRNITDSEKRNPKRQLRLQKDNLLFDNPLYDENIKNNNVSIDYIPINSDKIVPNANQQNSAIMRQNHESLFDNFNLEEFISSFSDNEQFPIFKNYKESLKSINLNKESENDDHFKENVYEHNKSENNNEIEYKTCADKPNERFVIEHIFKKPDVTVEAEEKMKMESGATHLTLNREKLLKGVNVDQDRMINAERELLESVKELALICNINTDEEDHSISSSVQHKKLKNQSSENTKSEHCQNSPGFSYQLSELIGVHPENLQNKLSIIQSSQNIESSESNKILTKQSLSPITLNKGMNTAMKRESYLDTLESSLDTNSFSGKITKISKFCHECGAKFIVDKAKFCMECGVKRVTIEK